MDDIEVRTNKIRSSEYKNIEKAVREKCFAALKHPALVDEIANKVIISMVRDSDQILNAKWWVEANIPKAVEDCFQDLRLYCFKHALEITSNPDLADDIAQESISSLLLSPKEITFIKGWLRKTTITKAIAYAKQANRQEKLAIDIDSYEKENYDPNEISEEGVYQDLIPKDAKKLLNAKDYAIYKALQKYDKLRDYAQAKGISYQTAREHSFIVKRNLRAAYLKGLGWNNRESVLDFRRVMSVKRFMNKMLQTYGIERKNIVIREAGKFSSQQLLDTFEGVCKIKTWGVLDITDRGMTIHLVHATLDVFILVRMWISINKANWISLLDIKRTVPDTISRYPQELQQRVMRTVRENKHRSLIPVLQQMVIDAGLEMEEGSSLREFRDRDIAMGKKTTLGNDEEQI